MGQMVEGLLINPLVPVSPLVPAPWVVGSVLVLRLLLVKLFRDQDSDQVRLCPLLRSDLAK